ncbi:uncharacterized protein A4U43_C07F19040 [Asparagus officinalis]|uniref:CCR4-Not complex component Not1 C-terminal domain-containing protein n=1 Tax=Asparagus officinalis TaxID=4686 RepID=A0A5P1EF06_ASPOF|nr:uncharacterized protein A4U43_C07F19040 [Asparagus officinalis]
MIPLSSTLPSQIRFLLHSASDSNSDSIFRELCQFVDYGIEGSILLLGTCLDQLNLKEQDVTGSQMKHEIVSSVFKYLLDKPNFCTVLCLALRGSLMNGEFLEELSKTLNLSIEQKIAVGLALSESEDLDFRTKGHNFCISQIEDLTVSSNLIVSNEHIQDIVLFLCRSEGLSKHVDSFTKILSLVPRNGSSLFAQAPVLADDISSINSSRQLELFYEGANSDFEAVLAEIEEEMSMADILKELGYGCTVNASHCKEILSLFLPLNEVTLSKLLGTIARSHVGLNDAQNIHSSFYSAFGGSATVDPSSLNTWNVDVLVDSIKQLAPKTDWTCVMENLDHEGFNIPDETSFSLLMSIYNKACEAPFPLHAICGSVWQNAEGQLSFLRHAVSAPPDVFTFAHCSRHLTYTDSANLSNGVGNQAWSCLDLLDVLCQLAESGHASSVRLIIEHPLNQFPDVLLLGVAQINSAYNLLQYEVSSAVFPIFLNDPMKNSILHHLWKVNPSLLLRGFSDARTDPNSIFRILDICQELKILSRVLDSAPFHVSLRLAAVAYRKEQVHLEKWVNENLNMYKDTFFEDCLAFLDEIFSDAVNDVPHSSLQQSHVAIWKAYQEACPLFFKILQANSGQIVSQKLMEEFKRLRTLFDAKIQSPGGTNSSTSEGSQDDIEAEANSYFHQMFSGQLTVDAIVEMLARFKESSENRERLIFDCMIANLFEEYRFFPKYPDRQLKLAAILFGTLIKHQLVTHLNLGFALRGVLDALRKSVDSKMFTFGIKALEQFVDRLVEWPQYCNHILQISHLRGTHVELVSVIERALARISSSQAEANGGNSLHAVQQQGSISSSVEGIEASETSWQFVNSSSAQFGQQLSPFHEKHQGFLGDRLKNNAMSINITKPLLAHATLPSLVSGPIDLVANPKPTPLQAPASQQSTNVSTVVSSSPGFLRPSRGVAPAGMLRQPSYSTGFGAALNIETLVAAAERRDTPIEAPASEVQDKILFMINNISIANTEAKAKEFTEILKEQYYSWFAQYMVMKRASIEPNFHELYLKFLDKVNSKVLNMEIIKATYENCKVLLRSELIKSSSEERSLLKNLGSWLGKFTIGRNQALRAREIDPKALIIEAYEKGLMIAVIPFTSKILEPSQSSLAYRPPNPWTMGILGLLVEIYNLPNLKMNLKFDIEVLFKNLGVDMKDVKPTSLLKDRVREVEGNPDFSTKDINVSQAPIVTEINSTIIPAMNQVDLQSETNSTSHPNVMTQYSSPLHPVPITMVEDEKVGPLIIPERVPSAQGLTQVAASQTPFSLSQLLPIIPNPESYIKINSKLSSLGTPQVHRIMQMAMDKAVTEIIAPIIQRSVTIASRTTKELVLKDYAMESDENAVSRAAHLMVATLAGSLAHVTCKESLRVALSTHLRSLLQANVNSEYMDHIIQILITDNLDLGCAVIENVASDKAVELIDGEIGPSFASLRKQREAAGSAYYDAAVQGLFARVPEALRPKPGRLSVGQQRVYDDFIRNIWQNQSSQSSSVVPTGPPGLAGVSVNSSLTRVFGSNSNQVNSIIYSSSQVSPGFSSAQTLDLMQEEGDHGSAPHSISSMHEASDELIQPAAEISSPASSFPPNVASSELHIDEASTLTKDLGAVIPPSPMTQATESTGTVLSETLLTTGDALDKYQQLALKLETLILKDARGAEVQGIIAEVPDIIVRCVSRDEAGLAVAQKVIYSDEDRKFNKDITIGLIHYKLLNLAEYNVHLAKLIDGGRNKSATEFAISLVQTLVIHEPGFNSLELYNVIDALGKLALRPGSPESLRQLIEIARNNTNTTASLVDYTANEEDKARQPRDKKVLSGRSLTNREDHIVAEISAADPTDFREQITHLFSEWCRMCEIPATNDTAYDHHISQLHQHGLLKGDDTTDRFFHILTELCVVHCLAGEQITSPSTLQTTQQYQLLSFAAVDAYEKLVVLILKYPSVDQASSRTILLSKILSAIVRVIQKDAEQRKSYFNPRPYFRLLVNCLIDLSGPDAGFDGPNLQVFVLFANAFHALQPLKVPGFSFAWLELVSHRTFMPKLLTTTAPNGWPVFQRLLVDLFKFMEPYLRNAELGEPVHFLYKGTLRVLLVLLHDFPEFLCDYHFSFCDVIPPSCIQMRNLILSAFPRNMRLPDPSTPNLKIDLLAEISQAPRILSDVDGALKAKQIKADIDEYLQTRPEGSTFLSELKQRLFLPLNEANLAGTRYNVPLINSLVLYVGMQAIQQLQSRSASQHALTQQMIHNSPMDIYLVGAAIDIFQSLIKNLDSEGRYLFLNAVANQLRYPNSHTHFFSFVLLYLFVEAGQVCVVFFSSLF